MLSLSRMGVLNCAWAVDFFEQDTFFRRGNGSRHRFSGKNGADLERRGKVIRLRLGRLLFFQQNLCKQGAHPLPFACQLATITLLNNMFIIGRIVEWRWSL